MQFEINENLLNEIKQFENKIKNSINGIELFKKELLKLYTKVPCPACGALCESHSTWDGQDCIWSISCTNVSDKDCVYHCKYYGYGDNFYIWSQHVKYWKENHRLIKMGADPEDLWG